jgi:hypothetical protein
VVEIGQSDWDLPVKFKRGGRGPSAVRENSMRRLVPRKKEAVSLEQTISLADKSVGLLMISLSGNLL